RVGVRTYGTADRLGEAPDAFDELEQALALEFLEHVAERGAEEVDVGAQLVEGRRSLRGDRRLGPAPPGPRHGATAGSTASTLLPSSPRSSAAAATATGAQMRSTASARGPLSSSATAHTVAGPSAGRKRRGILRTSRWWTSS